MSTPELVAKCDRYLESLHCVLWGQAFNAHHPKGRAEAAEWLARQIEGVDSTVNLVPTFPCPGCEDCQPPKVAKG